MKGDFSESGGADEREVGLTGGLEDAGAEGVLIVVGEDAGIGDVKGTAVLGQQCVQCLEGIGI